MESFAWVYSGKQASILFIPDFITPLNESQSLSFSKDSPLSCILTYVLHKAEMEYEPWYKLIVWQIFPTQNWIQRELECLQVRCCES